MTSDPIRITLTLALIGFLLAFVGLLWLRREERIRRETIENAEPVEYAEITEDDWRKWQSIWTAPEPPDKLYGLPNLHTRILHDLDDGSEDSIGDRPGPMIY